MSENTEKVVVEEKVNTNEIELTFDENSDANDIFSKVLTCLELMKEEHAKLFTKNVKAAASRYRKYALFTKNAMHELRKLASEHKNGIPTKPRKKKEEVSEEVVETANA